MERKHMNDSLRRKLLIVVLCVFVVLFLLVNASVLLMPVENVVEDKGVHQPPKPPMVEQEEKIVAERRAFVANQLSGEVSVVDLVSRDVVGKVKVEGGVNDIALENGAVYVAGEDITVLDAS